MEELITRGPPSGSHRLIIPVFLCLMEGGGHSHSMFNESFKHRSMKAELICVEKMVSIIPWSILPHCFGNEPRFSPCSQYRHVLNQFFLDHLDGRLVALGDQCVTPPLLSKVFEPEAQLTQCSVNIMSLEEAWFKLAGYRMSKALKAAIGGCVLLSCLTRADVGVSLWKSPEHERGYTAG